MRGGVRGNPAVSACVSPRPVSFASPPRDGFAFCASTGFSVFSGERSSEREPPVGRVRPCGRAFERRARPDAARGCPYADDPGGRLPEAPAGEVRTARCPARSELRKVACSSGEGEAPRLFSLWAGLGTRARRPPGFPTRETVRRRPPAFGRARASPEQESCDGRSVSRPFRRPGCLLEARGFASPPRGGFAFVVGRPTSGPSPSCLRRHSTRIRPGRCVRVHAPGGVGVSVRRRGHGDSAAEASAEDAQVQRTKPPCPPKLRKGAVRLPGLGSARVVRALRPARGGVPASQGPR